MLTLIVSRTRYRHRSSSGTVCMAVPGTSYEVYVYSSCTGSFHEEHRTRVYSTAEATVELYSDTPKLTTPPAACCNTHKAEVVVVLAASKTAVPEGVQQYSRAHSRVGE